MGFRANRANSRTAASFTVLRVLLVALVSASWVAIHPSPASAACGGSIVHDAVGGNEDSVAQFTRIGDRADVLVNNFGPNQHEVWRAVALLNGPNNFLEVGWVLRVDIFGNQSKHPYKTWVNLGVPQQEIIANVTFGAGTVHEFKVHDQNYDQNWSFAYDGNAMGNEPMAMTQGLPVSESERRCTTNSLVAEFKHLDKINCQNCGWTNYPDVKKYVNTTNDWKFCKRSETRYEVLKTC